MSLTNLSAFDLKRGIQSGEFTSEEVSLAFVKEIQSRDSELLSFLNFQPEDCVEQAMEYDRNKGPEKTNGGLGGVPVAIKDVICIKNNITTCGSRILEQFVPPYDATVIEKIRASNGILLGKTNMDEFAMGSSNENSAFGTTRNPWNLDHVPGGSSGGSASCVAAGLAPFSLGSDTGGSVRQPAAFCGITGLKPTYGRISRFGLVAFASSLDQIGILARDARDTAMLLGEIDGYDPRDSTSSSTASENYLENLSADLNGVRIGIPRDYINDGLDPEILEALENAKSEFEKQGVQFVDIELPTTRYGVAAYYLVASCEASGNLARYDGAHYGFRSKNQNVAADDQLMEMYTNSRSEGFGPEVKRRVMLGTYSLSSGYYDAYYLKALKTRRLIQNELFDAFQKVDLILGPTTPTTAYQIGEKSKDPLAMYLGDVYTVVANLAGTPAISFPAGISQSGLPIGLQLQAPAFSEQKLLNTVHAFQQETDWHQKRPASYFGGTQ